jgi:glycosyltransferase involved in cell wall biosynthesis
MKIDCSVVFPAKKFDKYCEDALLSLINQRAAVFEIIVIVSEGEKKNIRQFFESHGFGDYQLIEDRNRGLAAALNQGIALARSEIIIRMDSDDVCHQDRINTQESFLRLNPEIGLVASCAKIIDQNSDIIGGVYYAKDRNVKSRHLFFNNPIFHPSVAMRRCVVQAMQGYDESMIAEDYDLWLRMYFAGVKMKVLAQQTISYRQHTSQLSKSNSGIRRCAEISKNLFRYGCSHCDPVAILASTWWLVRAAGVACKNKWRNAGAKTR